MGSNQMDRNDYDISASQAAQANFETAASNLEAALARRDGDVRQAMAAYQADGVSDQYAAVERQWNQAGGEVRSIITTLRNSLATNDDLAVQAMTKAATYIPG